MNTRIQVEHGVTELAYRLRFTNPEDPSECFYVERLIEAMVLLAPARRAPARSPTRILRHVSGAEIRVNATNAALQPHAGGMIRCWSKPLRLRDPRRPGDRHAQSRHRLVRLLQPRRRLRLEHRPGAERRRQPRATTSSACPRSCAGWSCAATISRPASRSSTG